MPPAPNRPVRIITDFNMAKTPHDRYRSKKRRAVHKFRCDQPIVVNSAGEAKPLRKTEAGASEPQNRRVEVCFY
jgi:hypothetical protein